MTPEEKKVFRSVSETMFSMGTGREFRVSLKELLDKLKPAMSSVPNYELEKALKVSKAQFEVKIRAGEILEEIRLLTAELAAVNSKAATPSEMKAKAKIIQEILDNTP